MGAWVALTVGWDLSRMSGVFLAAGWALFVVGLGVFLVEGFRAILREDVPDVFAEQDHG